MMGRWEGRGGPREARKRESQEAGEREREKKETERERREEKTEATTVGKPESGKKWEVVNRTPTGFQSPPATAPISPPALRLQPGWAPTAGIFGGLEEGY